MMRELTIFSLRKVGVVTGVLGLGDYLEGRVTNKGHISLETETVETFL